MVKKYPTQDDAEFLVEFYNFLNNVSVSGSTIGKKIVDKCYTISRKEWDRVFGENSPWSTKKNLKNWKVRVVWDSEKAKRLGLE